MINALTLYSVFQAQLDPTSTDDVGSTLLGFFKNIGILAQQDHQQAAILSGMVFTFIIWVFGALSLLLALVFYLLFLWHYIPNADGGLSGYCERKINKRLARIVSVKVNKAIEKEERERNKADAKAIRKGEKPTGRQATLPTLFNPKSDDQLPQMPMLYRNDTMATLPVYSSRPGTPGDQPPMPGFELDSLGQKRPLPARHGAGGSFSSNATLVGNASDMGYGRSASPAPSLPPLDINGFPRAPQRTTTANSQNSQWNRGPAPPRMPSAMGDRGYTASPVSYDNPGMHRPFNPSQGSIDNYGGPPMPRASNGSMERSNTPLGPAPSMGRRTPFDPNTGRSSPAPANAEYGRLNSPAPTSAGYQAYNPNARSASNASPAPNSPPNQYRSITDPGLRGPPAGGNYYGQNAPSIPRPGTGQSGYGMNMNAGGRNSPARFSGNTNERNSPAPGYGGQGYRQ